MFKISSSVFALSLLIAAALATSCTKEIDTGNNPGGGGAGGSGPQSYYWVTSVGLQGKTGVQTCTDHAAKVVVNGSKDYVWFTTGTTDQFYKVQESCSKFNFKVAMLDYQWNVLNANVGAVDSNCNLTLDSSVTAEQSQLIQVSAISNDHPSASAKLNFGCKTGSGGAGGGGGTPNAVVISAVLLKNQQTGSELCSTTQGELVVQGTKNSALFSTDFMSGGSYEPCSNFDFEVNRVNFANVITSYNIGSVDFFCHLKLNSFESEYVQVKAKYKFDINASPATVSWKCQ